MISKQNSHLVNLHGNFSIWQDESLGHKALRSNTTFETDEALEKFSAGEIVMEPTYLTVQVGDHKHITLLPEHLQYINHSCEPNVFFNTTTMKLEALKNIAANEELTFFYPSTEWEMTQSFDCKCGSKHCLRHISGAAHIAFGVLKNYKLTDFIQGKLEQKSFGQSNGKVA